MHPYLSSWNRRTAERKEAVRHIAEMRVNGTSVCGKSQPVILRSCPRILLTAGPAMASMDSSVPGILHRGPASSKHLVIFAESMTRNRE
jgi:hypothetical protein